jgi:hypothetical protein
LAGRDYTKAQPLLSLAFGARSEDQRLEYCIDPAMKVFHGRIVGQDQIYVICAIEPVRDLPDGCLVRATLPKR